MLLWFIGTAVLSVWYVFRDPRFDYRPVIIGALIPDLIDIWTQQARWAHSITFAVGLMVVVMAVTAGRKPIRKPLLGLPIGVMLHLVWDAAFASTEVFWWPLSGDWGEQRLFSLDRGWVAVGLEAVGAVLLIWVWRRFRLDLAERRSALWATGRLSEGGEDASSNSVTPPPTC